MEKRHGKLVKASDSDIELNQYKCKLKPYIPFKKIPSIFEETFWSAYSQFCGW
jgi:hypothetical protein